MPGRICFVVCEQVGRLFAKHSTSGLWQTGWQSKLRWLIELTAVPNRETNKPGAFIDVRPFFPRCRAVWERMDGVSIVLGARSHKGLFMQTSGMQSPSVVLAGHAQIEGSCR